MKKIYLILAAITSAALYSCTSDEFVGNSPGVEQQSYSGEISFGFNLPAITRGGDLVGSDAANKLQNQFVVYGTKHASAEDKSATNDQVVFTNYKVEYTANSAGKTESNTQNWEYVGLSPYTTTAVSPVATAQAVKYWDYSATGGYTFYGIASKTDLSAATPTIKVTKITESTGTVYDKGYTVDIKNGAHLDQLYIADRKPVAKADYDKPVVLTFRNFGARIRVGFYETIPGYSVKIDNFYVDADASTASSTAPVTSYANMVDAKTNFAASLQSINESNAANTMTITYDTDNKPKIAATTVDYKYSLELGSGVYNTELSTSSATPTWDTPNSGNTTIGDYTTVYPMVSANPMLIKVDFTLTAEDGSNEEIHVKGATVIVPAQYLAWKNNFAYTYIFKISNKTNGKTSDIATDPEGLSPITFDAVVVNVADEKTEETITSFGNYSITTYANGSKVTTNNEYKSEEDIYIVKTDNSTRSVVAPSAIGTAAGNAQVYKATTTGSEGISEATVYANLTGSPNGITLTATTSGEAASLVQYVPAADGTNFDFGANGALKFKPSTNAAATYVYVFTRTAYVAPTYTDNGAYSAADFDSTKTYYFKTTEGVYYPASGISAANFNNYRENLYTQTAAGTAGEYDIKVIKVIP